MLGCGDVGKLGCRYVKMLGCRDNRKSGVIWPSLIWVKSGLVEKNGGPSQIMHVKGRS